MHGMARLVVAWIPPVNHLTHKTETVIHHSVLASIQAGINCSKM